MAYSFQTFVVDQVLTAAQMNQVEVNVRDHDHGAAGVNSDFTALTVDSPTFVVDDANGRVGFGTVTTTRNVTVLDDGASTDGISLLTSGATAKQAIAFADTGGETGAILYNHSGDIMSLKVGGSEFWSFISNGVMLFGHTVNMEQEIAGVTGTPILQLAGTTDGLLGLSSYSADATSNSIWLSKSRNATKGSHTIVAINDVLGSIYFNGSDGGTFNNAASIRVEVDGTPGVNDMPGALVFSTTTPGANTVADAMLINSSQFVGVGVTRAEGISARLHVNQRDTSGSIPVLQLEQLDISEEMIYFETTVGTGNAIESVGAKTLTTTHFIKIEINGAVRYIPAGTIA